MQPILNLTPIVYEAIIAAFALGSVISLFVLRRKLQENEKLQSILKTIVKDATKAVVAGATFGAIQVAKAQADTRRVFKALTNADARVQELEARVAELEAENADDDGEETSGLSAARLFGGPFGLNPRHPLAERFGGVERRHDPLGELFARLGRVGPDGPKVQAFRVTPTGLEPVRGPEDFLRGGTFNRSDVVRPPVPSLASILSVLAGMPAGFGGFGDPRRPDENAKADLTPDSFLRDVRFRVGNPGARVDRPGDARVDRPGDAFKYDDRDPTLTTINEAAHGLEHEPQPAATSEACDTQRAAPEPQKAPQEAPEPSVALVDQPHRAEPAARSEPRVPRYTPQGDFNSQSPRAG